MADNFGYGELLFAPDDRGYMVSSFNGFPDRQGAGTPRGAQYQEIHVYFSYSILFVTIQQRFVKMAKSPFCSFPIFFGSFLAFC
jgi:hypothetical protein